MTFTKIPELELTSVSQLVALVEKYGETSDHLYRGQSARFEKLTTTIERLRNLQNAQFSGHDLRGYEVQTLREYQRRVRHFLNDLPEPDDYFLWFSLMQHYGVPTRLLDVTKSIFVALYFATSHSDDSDGIIYTLFTTDYCWDVKDFGSENLKSIRTRFRGSIDYVEASIKVADHVVALDNQGLRSSKELPTNHGGTGLGLIEIRSSRPSKREIAQQGLFVMPTSLTQSFEENMFSFYQIMDPTWTPSSLKIPELNIHDYMKCPIVKFRIPRNCFGKIKLALRHMNITAESLFPDFEGLNKSMKERIDSEKDIYSMSQTFALGS